VTDPQAELERIRTIIRLQREFAQLYAQLSILPYGSTQNYNGSGARSSEHPGGRRPVGEAHPEAERLLDAWTAATWRIPAMERALEDGRTWLREFRMGREPEKLLDEKAVLKERMKDAAKMRGWEAKEVARSLHLTVAQVHEAREAVKCCPAKGYPYKGVGVVELANRGNSIRQIAAMLDIRNPTTVARILKKAA
jgi:hypothetical protein